MWGFDPSVLGENVCNCNYPLICGSATWGQGLDYGSTPPTHFVVSSFHLQLQKVFAGRFYSFLLLGVLRYNYGVPVRRNELKVFLLCHLGQFPFLRPFDTCDYKIITCPGFPGGSAGKESTCNVGDLGSIPGLGRSPGEGNIYPLQYSDLENSMDCIVHGVAKSWTQLRDFHFHFAS